MERQLRNEVLAQGLRFGGDLRVFDFVVVVARPAVAVVFVEAGGFHAAVGIGGARVGLAVGARGRRGAGHELRRAGRRGNYRFLAQTVFALEQRVFLQKFFDFLIELERRQLQQPDRLLQLRRERQMLGQPEL
jgi:hypothetical protein